MSCNKSQGDIVNRDACPSRSRQHLTPSIKRAELKGQQDTNQSMAVSLTTANDIINIINIINNIILLEKPNIGMMDSSVVSSLDTHCH